MKDDIKILCAIFILFAAAVAVYVFKPVTLYNQDGETTTAAVYKTATYKTAGWYTAPVRTMYSSDGDTICIYESETEQYEAEGWYTEPVEVLFAEDGSSSYIKESEVVEYINLGWSEEKPAAEGLVELKVQINDYVPERDGDWGVFVKCMDNNEYLSLNEKPYSSASLIKLFTMAALYNELENGTIAESDELDEQLTLMITESSNDALNYITKVIGGGSTVDGFYIENADSAALGFSNTEHLSELFDTNSGSAISIGYNTTSPMDCGILLEKIYKGTLVSEAASAEMLDLLLRQTRTWKIPAALPEGTVTANKTGENSKVEGDAAIVFSPGADYVISVIGNGDVSDGVETIKTISRMTYDYFN